MLKLLFVLLTIGPGIQSSFAQQGFAPSDPVVAPDARQRTAKAKRVKKTFMEVGGDLRSYTYEEPGFVKHSGFMVGIWGNYITKTAYGTFGIDSNLTFSNANKYDGGTCEYDPATDTTTCSPYETNSQTDIIVKSNALIYLPASDLLRFKGGLGYRYLSNSVPEAGFYLRTGAWIYVPLGVEILYNHNAAFKWKYELAYDHIVSGGIKSNLSNASTMFDDVYMTQSGYGLNTSFQLRYKNRYLISLFYETWSLNVSEVVYAAAGFPFSEPANQARMLGLRFGYDFY